MYLTEEIASKSYLEVGESKVELKGPFREKISYTFPSAEQAKEFAEWMQRFVMDYTKVKIHIQIGRRVQP